MVTVSLALQEHVNLRPYNTLGVDALARYFVDVHNEAELLAVDSLAKDLGMPLLALGGGSNLLLTQDVAALVVRINSRGIRLLSDDGEQVLVEAQAGEPWHSFVLTMLAQGFCGLENLSLIPGTVGAAPVQNIGAYGVEVRDVMAGLTALDRQTGLLQEFTPEQCQFAYRDSRFKQEAGRWLIVRVRFALQRSFLAHLEYGPLRQRLAHLECLTPLAVSQAVCAIRREKLPDPAELHNAGSFFKNPVISSAQAQRLNQRYPKLMAYPQTDGRVKLAAGWLIEQAGWKGFRVGDAGVHDRQALVLVNYGQATGLQMLALAKRIVADVALKFNVALEMEPVLI